MSRRFIMCRNVRLNEKSLFEVFFLATKKEQKFLCCSFSSAWCYNMKFTPVAIPGKTIFFFFFFRLTRKFCQTRLTCTIGCRSRSNYTATSWASMLCDGGKVVEAIGQGNGPPFPLSPSLTCCSVFTGSAVFGSLCKCCEVTACDTVFNLNRLIVPSTRTWMKEKSL